MPKRIQRKRTKGYRLPENCVYVGRPTRWGNPFKVIGQDEYLFCDASHRRSLLCRWVIFDHEQDIEASPATRQMAVDHYRRWVTGEFDGSLAVRPRPTGIEALRGKDLACWCPLDRACHADVLLELANQ